MTDIIKRYGIKVTTDANYSYILRLHPQGVEYSVAFHVCNDYNSVRASEFGSELFFEPIELPKF